jgi:hypothetical protein
MGTAEEFGLNDRREFAARRAPRSSTDDNVDRPASSVVRRPSSVSQMEDLVCQLWSAYAYLRETDLRHLSGTSRLLHEANLGYLCSRLSDELLELAGVLSGEHRHNSRNEDAVLESSQVCYWTYLVALCSEATYENLRPHEHLVGSAERSALPMALLAEEIRSLAGLITSHGGRDVLPLLARALQAVGEACRACGVDVLEVVSYDLDQMAARSYVPGVASDSEGSG